MRVEQEYRRCGAWAYLAAWDVHHANLFGRFEAKTGIQPFDCLVEQAMSQVPYCDARRVSGSSTMAPRTAANAPSIGCNVSTPN